MLAPPPARPAHRRRAAPPLPGGRATPSTCRSSSRTTRRAPGVQMTSDFLLALAAESPQCRVIKLEEEPTPPKAGPPRRRARPTSSCWAGSAARCCSRSCAAGSHGTMTGFGFPEVLVAVVRRWFAGDRDGAAAVFDRYATLIRFENQALLNLPIRKVVYQRRGAIAHATVRAPGVPPDPGTLADLDDVLRRTGLDAHLAPGRCCRRCSPERPAGAPATAAPGSSPRPPARSRPSRTTPPARAGTPPPGRSPRCRRSARAGSSPASASRSPRG